MFFFLKAHCSQHHCVFVGNISHSGPSGYCGPVHRLPDCTQQSWTDILLFPYDSIVASYSDLILRTGLRMIWSQASLSWCSRRSQHWVVCWERSPLRTTVQTGCGGGGGWEWGWGGGVGGGLLLWAQWHLLSVCLVLSLSSHSLITFCVLLGKYFFHSEAKALWRPSLCCQLITYTWPVSVV